MEFFIRNYPFLAVFYLSQTQSYVAYNVCVPDFVLSSGKSHEFNIESLVFVLYVYDLLVNV